MPPLVSVLTPVYNDARYLRQCIESVLAQTYETWQYVIVDNCSTDDSGAIAREYAARDPRIRVVTNDRHVGALENHNIAFRQMAPDAAYCKVVQADDWLFPTCLAEMVALAETHRTVGVVSAYVLHGRKVELDGLPWPSTVMTGREICRWSLLGGGYVFGSPTSVMFRADIVRRQHAFFDESISHADEAACYDVLREWDFGFVHQVLSFTRVHDEDGSRSGYARRMNTYLAENIWLLQTYGPVFLDHAEQEARLAVRLDRYDRYLANNIFRRDPEFWTFHRRALEELGFPLSVPRLLAIAASGLFRTLANPGKLWGRLRSLASRQRGQDVPDAPALVERS